jgi:hypothetical protein
MWVEKRRREQVRSEGGGINEENVMTGRSSIEESAVAGNRTVKRRDMFLK